MAKKKEVALKKRIKISKTQQQILLAVLVTSLVLGVTAMVAVWAVKYISFNARVIAAKDESISDYEKTIKNVEGLRDNIMLKMSGNEYLERVARDSIPECYEDGVKKDYNELYAKAKDEDKLYYVNLAKLCSALRVVPDALPASENLEAVLSSVNKLFYMAGVQPSRLAPDDTVRYTDGSDVEGLVDVPIIFTVERVGTEQAINLLRNVELSIRQFDINTVMIAWGANDQVEMRVQGNAYYIEPMTTVETSRTVTATEAKGAKKK